MEKAKMRFRDIEIKGGGSFSFSNLTKNQEKILNPKEPIIEFSGIYDPISLDQKILNTINEGDIIKIHYEEAGEKKIREARVTKKTNKGLSFQLFSKDIQLKNKNIS